MVDLDFLVMFGHVINFDMGVGAGAKVAGITLQRKAPQKHPC